MITNKPKTGPRASTLAAFNEADAHPTHWVPLRHDVTPQLVGYYISNYPQYDFTYRQGSIYVKSKREESI